MANRGAASPREDTVLAALAQRRAELAEEADALLERLDRIKTDIGHVEAVMRLLAPDRDLAAIRPRRSRERRGTAQGDIVRGVLDELRRAEEPLTAREIARRIEERRGPEAEDDPRSTGLPERIARALRHQARSGVVRSIKELRAGDCRREPAEECAPPLPVMCDAFI